MDQVRVGVSKTMEGKVRPSGSGKKNAKPGNKREVFAERNRKQWREKSVGSWAWGDGLRGRRRKTEESFAGHPSKEQKVGGTGKRVHVQTVCSFIGAKVSGDVSTLSLKSVGIRGAKKTQ